MTLSTSLERAFSKKPKKKGHLISLKKKRLGKKLCQREGRVIRLCNSCGLGSKGLWKKKSKNLWEDAGGKLVNRGDLDVGPY